MKYLIGIAAIAWGIFVLVRRRSVAANGARFNQRMAQRVPAWGQANPNTSDKFWKYFAPALGVGCILVGLILLIFVPS